MSRRAAIEALTPLARGSLLQAERKGLGASLTGPVPRGDVETLTQAALALRQRLSAYGGVSDVADSFRAGKQVRSDTPMGRGACSVSSAAVEMLAGRMTDFDRPVILFRLIIPDRELIRVILQATQPVGL